MSHVKEFSVPLSARYPRSRILDEVRKVDSELWDQRLNESVGMDSSSKPHLPWSFTPQMEKLRQEEKMNKWLGPDMDSAVSEKTLFLSGLRDTWTDKSGIERKCDLTWTSGKERSETNGV